ncbi:hypothetical protein ACFLXN_02900 [Chloroflexota bacterium]
MYPEEIKQRALELNRDRSAGQAYKSLMREFPDVEVPDERTIRRWANEAGAEALNERQEVYVKEHKQAHFAQLVDIANMLLGDELGSLLNVEGDTYSIIEEGRWTDKTKSELTSMIEGNIDNICSILTAWEFFDMFVAHLEYENDELKQDFYKYINDKPLEFVNLVRTLAQRKVFKGKCPVCEEWQQKL